VPFNAGLTAIETFSHHFNYILIIRVTLLTNMWESDCCSMPNEQLFSFIMARTRYPDTFHWDYDDVCFVLDWHA